MDVAHTGARVAILARGAIAALDSPEAVKAGRAGDRVQITTEDEQAAIAALADRFGIDAQVAEGQVTFSVPGGEEFVPRLFGELGVPIRSVSVSRPTLDDVFMSYTGSTIRDAEESADRQRSRMMMQVMTRGRR